MRSRKDELIGKEFDTNKSGKCVIIDYTNAKNIVVKFHNPHYLVKCSLSSLVAGEVRNKLYPSFYNKGFVGVGVYSIKDRKVFNIWNAMLKRTYCKKHLKTYASYKDVEVCEDWLDFQNFAKWCYNEPYYDAVDSGEKSYCLDKDILVKGNKIYSPDSCCFVPQDVNKLLVSRDNLRGEHPIGVCYLKPNKKFQAAINYHGKSKYLGLYNKPEEAFQAYKFAKESHIKFMANLWKDRIDDKVYQALINYEVHIDD